MKNYDVRYVIPKNGVIGIAQKSIIAANNFNDIIIRLNELCKNKPYYIYKIYEEIENDRYCGMALMNGDRLDRFTTEERQK